IVDGVLELAEEQRRWRHTKLVLATPAPKPDPSAAPETGVDRHWPHFSPLSPTLGPLYAEDGCAG
ncbi:MAG TPA: hypothetical protein VKQ30_05675, partial [Ktedonobacterales bacterium]|nr:hypothetical protein [Ktedonobacterales bacterium]